MPEMEPLFREMMDTLQAARAAMAEDLERLEVSEGADRQALLRLANAARDFAAQANSLLLMMLDRDADPGTTQDVEDLGDFFLATLMRLEDELGAGKGEAEEG